MKKRCAYHFGGDDAVSESVQVYIHLTWIYLQKLLHALTRVVIV